MMLSNVADLCGNSSLDTQVLKDDKVLVERVASGSPAS